MKLYNEFESMTSTKRMMRWGYLGSIDADFKPEDIVQMLGTTGIIDESSDIPNCSFTQIEYKGEFYRVYKKNKLDGTIITRVYKMLPTIEDDKDFEWERKVIAHGCNTGRVYYFGRPKFYTGLHKYYCYYYLDSGEIKVCYEANPSKSRFWINSEYAANKYLKANIIYDISVNMKRIELAMKDLEPDWNIDDLKGQRYRAFPEHN